MKPEKVRLHKASKQLELEYDETSYRLDAEYLRVHSPSAEVRGHGKPILQYGKKGISITGLEAVGRYGLKINFSDGHDTGIFSWPYLAQLCKEQTKLWEEYLKSLHEANKSREPNTAVVQIK